MGLAWGSLSFRVRGNGEKEMRSKWLLKDNLAGFGPPYLSPSCGAIVPFGPGARAGHQLRHRVSGLAQAGAGVVEQGTADAASLVVGRDKQRPHPAVARIAGR